MTQDIEGGIGIFILYISTAMRQQVSPSWISCPPHLQSLLLHTPRLPHWWYFSLPHDLCTQCSIPPSLLQ